MDPLWLPPLSPRDFSSVLMGLHFWLFRMCTVHIPEGDCEQSLSLLGTESSIEILSPFHRFLKQCVSIRSVRTYPTPQNVSVDVRKNKFLMKRNVRLPRYKMTISSVPQKYHIQCQSTMIHAYIYNTAYNARPLWFPPTCLHSLRQKEQSQDHVKYVQAVVGSSIEPLFLQGCTVTRQRPMKLWRKSKLLGLCHR